MSLFEAQVAELRKCLSEPLSPVAPLDCGVEGKNLPAPQARAGLILQNEVPGYDLLAAERGHGVDARQVGDLRVGIAPDDAGFPVHRNAGEVAHVLLGAGELVE